MVFRKPHRVGLKGDALRGVRGYPLELISDRHMAGIHASEVVGLHKTAVTPAEVVYTAIANLTANTLTPSFVGVAIGTAVVGRRVVVGTHPYYSNDVPTLSSMAIAGGAAAEVIDPGAKTSVLVGEIWDRQVDTGTTTTIAPVWGGAATSYSNGIVVWEVHNVSGGATDTDEHFLPSGVGTNSVTVTVPDGGVVLAYGTFSSNPTDITWGGVDEDVAETLMCDADCAIYQAGASRQYLVGGDKTITMLVSTTTLARHLLVAVYSPA